MAVDMSFIQLFLHASITVKLVMLILLGLSVFSWMFIFQKRKVFKQSLSNSKQFEQQFWSGIDLNAFYNKLLTKKGGVKGLEAIFISGFEEYIRLQKQTKVDGEIILKGVQRVMDICTAKETSKLDKNLPFLATVQSMSPYIGLFGTVWGIMHSFKSLSTVQQATIAMVAPGISEALIATAMGLIAAIPAGIAYNRFINTSNQLAEQYQLFSEEFMSFLYRKIYAKK